MRKAAMLFATASLITLAACSNGTAIPTSLSAPAPEQFILSVLPETYDFGGSAREISLRQHHDGTSIQLEVLADAAQGLKALYFRLDYDPQVYSPAGIEVSDSFCRAEQRIDLTLSSMPGVLEHGSIQLHPQLQSRAAGFSGSGVLATLRFEPRAFAGARRVSTPPTSAAAQSPLFSNGSPGNLLWFLANPGDYDQNGLVAVQDLTPIGISFGASVPAGAGADGRDYGSALDVIDGSDDGVINVQDLTAIGVNYGNRVAGWNLYSAADSSGYPLDFSAPSSLSAFGTVDISFSTTDVSQQRRAYDYTDPAPPAGPLFWVRPFDSQGTEGTPSEIYDSGTPNQPPVIVSVVAEPNQSPPDRMVQLTVSATDPDGDAPLYTWSLDSGAGHLLRTDASYGVYNGYFTGSNNEIAQLTLTVTDGKGGIDTEQLQVTVNNSFEGQFLQPPVQLQGWVDNSGSHSSLIEVAGFPRVYYYNESGTEGNGVFMAMSGSPFGNHLSDWALVGKVGEGGSLGLAAAAIGDRSGFATRAGASNLVWYYQPGPFNLQHNSVGIDPTNPVGIFPSLCLSPGGQPMISYHNDQSLGTGSLRFVGANDALSDDWRGPVAVAGEPESPGVELGTESSIAIINGNPAIAYSNISEQRLLYVRASDANGTLWNAPLPAVVDNGVGFVELGGAPALLALADGRPAIFYKRRAVNFGPVEAVFRVANDANGNAWSAVANVISTSVNNASSLSVAPDPEGMPALAFCVDPGSGGMCNVAFVSDINGAGAVMFNAPVACSINGIAFRNPSLAFIGGRAAVSIYDETNQDLYYNIRW